MSKKFNDQMFDKRTIKKSVERGVLDPKEYEEFLKSLPDESKNVESLKVFVEDENVLSFSSMEKV